MRVIIKGNSKDTVKLISCDNEGFCKLLANNNLLTILHFSELELIN
jgi:hypothetical protein